MSPRRFLRHPAGRRCRRPAIRLALLAGLTALGCATARADLKVTSATLTGPTMIECGKSATYVWTLVGAGAGNILGTDLLWSVFDEDPIHDDVLIDETKFNVKDGPGGGFFVQGQFTLTCTKDCEVVGKDGNSGEGEPDDPAEVFVLFEHTITGIDVRETNVINVTCVPEPGAVATTSVMAGALALCLVRRRLLRRPVR